MSHDLDSADMQRPAESKIAKDRQPNRLPISLWIACGFFALVPVARWLFFEKDHQLANLAGIGVAVLGGLAAYVGIWRLVANTWFRRLSLLLAPFVLVAVYLSLFEFVGMTGETLPVFRSRLGNKKTTSIPATSTDFTAAERNRDRGSLLSPIESTQFLGSDRNGIVQEDRFSVLWNEQLPSVLWKVPIGAGWSSFAVSDGLAITSEQIDAQECLTAFELTTGSVVWRFMSPGRHYHPMGGLGPRATPTIHQGKVFSQSALGVVSCVKLKTGELVWQQDLLKLAGISQEASEIAITWGRSGSPLVFDNQVVVPFGGKAGAADLKTLICFDLNTGNVLWTGGDQQISYSSPALLTLRGVRQIVSVNEGSATGHDPKNGNVLWSTPWPSRSNGEACSSQPVAVDDHRLLLGRGYALGSKMIEVQFSNSNRENALDPTNWKVDTVWASHKVLKTKFTSAIPYNGLLYGLSDGVLECIDPKDGARIWRGKRYGHGQAIIVNGHILVTSEEGRIALIPATESSRGKPIAEMPVLDGITWNVPVVAGPYLLIRNAEFAACLISNKGMGQDAGTKPDVQ